MVSPFSCVWVLGFLSAATANELFARLFDVGPCFEIIEPPECHTTLAESFTPQNPVSKNRDPVTEVFLFTPTNPDKAEPLHRCGGRLPKDSTYDPEAQTEVFIHGWLDGVCRTAWMREMKEQLYLRQNNDNSTKFNVILVDWSWGNILDYFEAAVNSKVVGEQTGFVINNIMKETCVSADKFHVIGHSFGAIAAGFVGRSVPGLPRITGLDPAFAPLQHAPPDQRLTYRDAKIVDIIHTNGGDCFATAVGDARFLGHADFYPNGGTLQLSCYIDLLKSILKGDLLYALVMLDPRICNHVQSIQYYKASINNHGTEYVGAATCSYERFKKGVSRSNRLAVMGMDFEKYSPRRIKCRRKYFLDTSLSCPYYDGSYLEGFKFPFKTS